MLLDFLLPLPSFPFLFSSFFSLLSTFSFLFFPCSLPFPFLSFLSPLFLLLLSSVFSFLFVLCRVSFVFLLFPCYFSVFFLLFSLCSSCPLTPTLSLKPTLGALQAALPSLLSRSNRPNNPSHPTLVSLPDSHPHSLTHFTRRSVRTDNLPKSLAFPFPLRAHVNIPYPIS